MPPSTRRLTPSERLARWLILASQHTPFRGSGGYAQRAAATVVGPAAAFAEAEIELSLIDEFFKFFSTPHVADLLRGKLVLDFGCGYGGRTVGYATQYGARRAIGVEVYADVIARCEKFAGSKGVTNCTFLLGTQQHIPLPDASIDVICSYDVLEHVEDPPTMMRELHRVLRPGGKALLVFTPYHGANNHHLGYITNLPAMHWIFSARTLVHAINSILSEDLQRFGTKLQPEPKRSYNDRRDCLPLLGGLTSGEFRSLLNGFKIHELQQRRLYPDAHTSRKPLARLLDFIADAADRLVSPLGDPYQDAFKHNVVCLVERRE